MVRVFAMGFFARPMQYIYEFNFNWLLIVCMALAIPPLVQH